MTTEDSESDQDRESYYRTPGNHVYHENEDCHHLANANEIEEIDKEEAESGRRCNQCAYDSLSWEEKRKRKRRRRRNRSTTVKIRRNKIQIRR